MTTTIPTPDDWKNFVLASQAGNAASVKFTIDGNNGRMYCAGDPLVLLFDGDKKDGPRTGGSWISGVQISGLPDMHYEATTAGWAILDAFLKAWAMPVEDQLRAVLKNTEEAQDDVDALSLANRQLKDKVKNLVAAQAADKKKISDLEVEVAAMVLRLQDPVGAPVATPGALPPPAFVPPAPMPPPSAPPAPPLPVPPIPLPNPAPSLVPPMRLTDDAITQMPDHEVIAHVIKVAPTLEDLQKAASHLQLGDLILASATSPPAWDQTSAKLIIQSTCPDDKVKAVALRYVLMFAQRRIFPN